MDVEMEPEEPALIIDLPIYEYVREAQLQHGLKYDDHRQYRSYCSRRIHRIRRSLNVMQGIASSAKARHTRARKLIDVSNVMVLEAGKKSREYAERMLVIPLFLAERAWSHTMQLKQEVAEYPRRRFHIIRRLGKAAYYATYFKSLVHDPESPCSERTKKEALAYDDYISGLFSMERGVWIGTKEDFYNSLLHYTTLSLSVTSKTSLEQYRLRIEDIRALLRYCTFTLGEKPVVHKVKLPANLQFNDIAFRHVRHLQEQESKQLVQNTQVSSLEEAVTPPVKPSDVESSKPVGAKASKPAAQDSVAAEDEEEDKFEETQEAMEEDQSEEEEQSETESDDEDQQESRGGGVTGLVKNWLGGAWS